MQEMKTPMNKTGDRTITLLRPSTKDEPGVFCIKIKSKLSYYSFQEIPCEIGGRGFALKRVETKPIYHVRIGAKNDCSCECLGYLRHGHCKHLEGLLALVAKKVI